MNSDSQTAEQPYGHLVGHHFGGSRYTLPAHVSWLWADAVGAVPDASAGHPSIAYFLATQALDAGITGVFEMLDADAESGVVLGEVELDFSGAIVPGTTYDCAAEVLAIDRKQGARMGTFDRLSLLFTVRAADRADVVVRCTAIWIFPRTEA